MDLAGMLRLGTCGPGWDVGTGNFMDLAGMLRLGTSWSWLGC